MKVLKLALFVCVLIPFVLIAAGISLLGKSLYWSGEYLKNRYFDWVGRLLG